MIGIDNLATLALLLVVHNVTGVLVASLQAPRILLAIARSAAHIQTAA